MPEADLFSLKEGQKVTMELYWESESGKAYHGEIASIAHVNTAQKEGTANAKKTYSALATLDADERIRAGMTVIVNVDQ